VVWLLLSLTRYCSGLASFLKEIRRRVTGDLNNFACVMPDAFMAGLLQRRGQNPTHVAPPMNRSAEFQLGSTQALDRAEPELGAPSPFKGAPRARIRRALSL